MSMAITKPSRWFLFNTLALSLVGYVLFVSASLGLLGREGARFNIVATKQLIILAVGLVFFFIFSKIDYRHWRRLSLWLFSGSMIFTLLVFVPGLGFSANGASRWVLIGPLTIQPSEFLKLAFVLYLGAWLARSKTGNRTIRQGLLPLLILFAIVSAIIIAEPDIDTLVIIFASGLVMYFMAGAKWRHLALLLAIVLAAVITVSFF